MSNKQLIILFGVLLGIFVLSKIVGGKKDRSFEKEIASIDTDKVDMIIFHPKSETDEGFSLVKEQDKWSVKNKSITAEAISANVASLLSNLNQLEAKKIVTKSENKWPDYEVNLEKGKRIEIKGKNKTIEDLIIGRLNFNQQARTAVTYIRKNNQSNVYAVDGFLSMQLNQDMNSFRNKKITELNTDSLSRIAFIDEHGEHTLTKQNYWLDESNTVIDSNNMAKYLLGLSSISGKNFDDQFDNANAKTIKSLTINSINGDELDIKCYYSHDPSNPFVLWSSQNPNAYFLADSTGAYEKLFGYHSLFN